MNKFEFSNPQRFFDEFKIAFNLHHYGRPRVFHSLEGPVQTTKDGPFEYWVDGKKYSKDGYSEAVRLFEVKEILES